LAIRNASRMAALRLFYLTNLPKCTESSKVIAFST
jgi:hypothetical protein